MATLTFSIAGAGAFSHSKAFTLTTGNIMRMLAQIKAGEPGLSNEQAMERWAELMFALTKDRVLQHEHEVAAIPPFDAT